MAFTSRGGVGCCWVKPLIRLTNCYFSLLARTLFLRPRAEAIVQSSITSTKYHKVQIVSTTKFCVSAAHSVRFPTLFLVCWI